MHRARTRAVRQPNNTVSSERYDLYRCALGRIANAIESKFYLEAIGLVESLISDRLESRITEVTGKDFSFKTLGQLIMKMKKIEQDINLRTIIINDLDRWREKRNIAAHEMVKIEQGNTISWADRISINENVANEGIDLFRQIDTMIANLRN